MRAHARCNALPKLKARIAQGGRPRDASNEQLETKPTFRIRLHTHTHTPHGHYEHHRLIESLTSWTSYSYQYIAKNTNSLGLHT
jgi:hypothetical protein